LGSFSGTTGEGVAGAGDGELTLSGEVDFSLFLFFLLLFETETPTPTPTAMRMMITIAEPKSYDRDYITRRGREDGIRTIHLRRRYQGLVYLSSHGYRLVPSPPSPRICFDSDSDGPNALWGGVGVETLYVTGSGVKNGSREAAMMGEKG